MEGRVLSAHAIRILAFALGDLAVQSSGDTIGQISGCQTFEPRMH
jgi:hypothetical protein